MATESSDKTARRDVLGVLGAAGAGMAAMAAGALPAAMHCG